MKTRKAYEHRPPRLGKAVLRKNEAANAATVAGRPDLRWFRCGCHQAMVGVRRQAANRPGEGGFQIEVWVHSKSGKCSACMEAVGDFKFFKS